MNEHNLALKIIDKLLASNELYSDAYFDKLKESKDLGASLSDCLQEKDDIEKKQEQLLLVNNNLRVQIEKLENSIDSLNSTRFDLQQQNEAKDKRIEELENQITQMKKQSILDHDKIRFYCNLSKTKD